MRLTPLDIRKQEFSRGFRGFDEEEVSAFLQMVANQWEELQDENRRRGERIRELENKMAHYEKVEEALQEALHTARESSRKALEQAEEKAAMMIERAEQRAQEIKRQAEEDRHELKRETVKLSGRRSEIVTRLRAFLMSEMELLARYEGDDPVGFIKLLPAEEDRVRQLSERLAEEGAESEVAPASSSDGGAPHDVQDETAVQETGQDAPDGASTESEWAGGGAADADPASSMDVPGGSEPSGGAEAREHRVDHGPARPSPSDEVTSLEASDDLPPIESDAAGESEWSPSTPEEEMPGRPGEQRDDSEREQPAAAQEEEPGRPGWTAETLVSGQSGDVIDDDASADAKDGSPHDASTEDDGSADEIEKIRRILSDLD